MSKLDDRKGIRASKANHNLIGKAGDGIILDTNEKILADINNIYGSKDFGLCQIGNMVREEIPMTRRKITILLLGNHSAGKSSFINWYIEQNILKTGVAIETQGFSFVTSGKKRDTLKGSATLQLYSHLKPLINFQGVLDFLTTEICTSRAKNFNMVTFVDTPGLVDGDMHYPFDVNKTLFWLGEIADLVFVFFDPMGQALCKRTLNILEDMWGSYSEKIRLYLAKSDEAGTETDRQKVLMQIVQELCKRQGLNRSGFDMPTIYLPDILANKPTKCANQIDEVCAEISKCIEQNVQNSLNSLENDCKFLKKKVDLILKADLQARERNYRSTIRGTFLSGLGVILPIILFSSIIVAKASETSMNHHLGTLGPYVRKLILPIATVWDFVPQENYLPFVLLCVGLSAGCLIFSRICYPTEEVLSKKDLKSFQRSKEFLDEYLEKKTFLYAEYLRQSVSEEEYNHAS